MSSVSKVVLKCNSKYFGHLAISLLVFFGTFGSLKAQISIVPVIKTIAGTGSTCNQGVCGDGGLATSANLYYPYGVAVDNTGNIYIADFVDNRIRKVAAGTGIITTIVGIDGAQCPAPVGSAPTGVCGDGGPPLSANLYNPTGVAINDAGDLYIADGLDQRIRKVSVTTGLITTIAGTGVSCATTTGPCGDGGAATSAQLGPIYGLALDSVGNVYISDTADYRIRKVTVATGIITTVAGNGNSCTPTNACGDGGLAINATLAKTYDTVSVDILV
jgi:hypothetical protein